MDILPIHRARKLTPLGERLIKHSNSTLPGFQSRPLWKRLLYLPMGIIGFIVVVIAEIDYVIRYVIISLICGKENTVKTEVSKTALITSRHRTIGNILGLNDDFLSQYFNSIFVRLYGYGLYYYRLVFGSQNTHLYSIGYLQSRTQFIDNLLMNSNAYQIVILGAGMDTRFYRLHEKLPPDCKLFEVDTKYTLAYKLNVINYNRSVFSTEICTDTKKYVNRVTYCECNFEDENFMSILKAKGYDENGPADRPTIFIMEGVSYYLQKEDVMETINKIRHCRHGTILCFDFATNFWDDSEENRAVPSVRTFIHFLKKIGEPFRFGISPSSSPEDTFCTRNIPEAEIDRKDVGESIINELHEPVSVPREDTDNTDSSRRSHVFQVEAWLGSMTIQQEYLRLEECDIMRNYHNLVMNFGILSVVHEDRLINSS